MYRIIISTILALTFQNCFAQNLVPNPSFETYTACPPGMTYLYYAQPWFQPGTYFGTTTNSCSSDLFSTCAGSGPFVAGVPANGMGSETARTGSNYSGIGVWFVAAESREYIEVPLISPLVAGNNYTVSFYVSLSDSSNYAITNLGAFFSQDSLLDTTYYVISYITPQVINNASNLLTNKSGWTLVTENYLASGGEQFMTIGNFQTNASSNYQYLYPSGWDRAYYYIDDISVVYNSSIGITENNLNDEVTLYSDHANDQLLIHFKINNINKIQILNLFDQLVYEGVINSKDSSINLSDLKRGVYFFSATTGTTRLVKKFVKD